MEKHNFEGMAQRIKMLKLVDGNGEVVFEQELGDGADFGELSLGLSLSINEDDKIEDGSQVGMQMFVGHGKNLFGMICEYVDTLAGGNPEHIKEICSDVAEHLEQARMTEVVGSMIHDLADLSATDFDPKDFMKEQVVEIQDDTPDVVVMDENSEV